MRKLLAVLLLLVPLTAPAQSVISVLGSQCVWRTGNNPAWASPALDDSGWKHTSFTQSATHTSYWMRCRVNFSTLQNAPAPAIAVHMNVAYQVYFNGRLVGSNGNMATGAYDAGGRNLFLLPAGSLKQTPSLVGVHLSIKNPLYVGSQSFHLFTVGGAQSLQAYQNNRHLTLIVRFLPIAICYGAIGVVAIMLFGLYLTDRSRYELLLLAIVCCLNAIWELEVFFSYFPWHMGAKLFFLLKGVADPRFAFYIPFFFLLAHRRIPWLYRVVMVLPFFNGLADLAAIFLPSAVVGPWLDALQPVIVLIYAVNIVAAAAPFVAFWPWRKVAPQLRPMAIFSMLWALTAMSWWISVSAVVSGLVVLAPLMHAYNSFQLARAVATATVLVVLFVLLFRDQRRVAEERAVLAGEMQAAQEVQRHLVPLVLPSLPGLRCEAAYIPAAEVGGDFYQILPQPDGSTLIIVGDVSGKGLKAAMRGSVALGAVRSLGQDKLSPSQILTRLNRQLAQSSDGGFITCLCVHISPSGTLTVANAGHLSPYRNGEEIPLDSGLPLGITEAAEYSEKSLQLNPGDTLTFLSDGVIEARNPQGELYGFDRTREVSTQSAEAIAQAASTFGQEDDITVLTLAYAGTGAAAT